MRERAKSVRGALINWKKCSIVKLLRTNVGAHDAQVWQGLSKTKGEQMKTDCSRIQTMCQMTVLLCLLMACLIPAGVQGQGTHIAYDTYLTDLISPLGDMDIFTFTGSAGDSILLRVDPTGAQELRIEVFSPSGARIAHLYSSNHGVQVVFYDLILPESGSYTIYVAEKDGNETGGYWLTLQCHFWPISIDCPGPVDMTICDPGAGGLSSVDMELQIENATWVSLSSVWVMFDDSTVLSIHDGAHWENDTLNFIISPPGEYHLSVTAHNDEGDVTCDLIVNVDFEAPITLDTDNLTFFTYDTSNALPDPQYIHISSTCPPGSIDWEIVGGEVNWMEIDKTAGTNPDSVQVTITDLNLVPGIYTTLLEFVAPNNNAPDGVQRVSVDLSILVESGVDVGDAITLPGNAFSVPIKFFTSDTLEGFTLPLKFGNAQPLGVVLDSISFNRDYIDSVIFNGDSSNFVLIPIQPPPPPDSVIIMGRVHMTAALGAQPEEFLIDTTTTEIGGVTYSYQFVLADGSVTIPHFSPGVITLTEDVITDVRETTQSTDLPASYELMQNYPNPFNPSTTIRFSLPTAGEVRLDVFNILGRHVTTLVDQRLSVGDYSVDWNGVNITGGEVASGIYFYRLTVGDFVETKKMIMLK